jgi:hypothetical protein
MISFNNLGNLGRLANQMFQYASLKGIAKNRGYDFAIPPREVFGSRDDNVKNSDIILYDLFDLESVNKISLTQQPTIQERVHHFDKELFDTCPDNVDLLGYFQTEKYFKHIEDEIRSDFTFKEDLLELCKSFIYEDTISLHIRRGDYVLNPNHPVQPMSYYEQALAELPELPVIIFSDDSEWCKEQELFSDDRFIVAEGNSTDCDLCLMSLCKYHIIANSSFSWWGAWLANSKKVIAPKNWFGGDCANKSAEDMSFGNFEFI